MKKITLSLALVALGYIANAQSTSVETQSSIQTENATSSEYRTGTIVELTENGGRLIDTNSGEMRDFYHPGAQVEYIIGDAVSYRLITFPNGKPPIVIDVKKPS